MFTKGANTATAIMLGKECSDRSLEHDGRPVDLSVVDCSNRGWNERRSRCSDKRHSRVESTGLGTDLLWKMKTNEKVKILASRLRKGPCETQTGSRER